MTRMAKAVKLYLTVHGVNQRTLAKAWECTPSTVTRFLQGRKVDASTSLNIFRWLLEESKDG